MTELRGAAKRAHELKVIRDDARALANRHIILYNEIMLQLHIPSIYDEVAKELKFRSDIPAASSEGGILA